MKPLSVVVCIVGGIIALGATAYWDERREATESLADFGREQAALSREFAAALRADGARSVPTVGGFRDAFASIDQPGAVVAMIRPPGATGMMLGSGETVRMPRVEAALDDASCLVEASPRDACSLALSHEESVQLGLPARMGMAGLAGFSVPGGGRWGVAVVAGAARERDRERRAGARTVLSFVVSSALVLAFGTFALRKQRRELILAGELAVADAVRARDERLVRADKLATLGALASGIAHEVSTPLGVIVGRAEQLATKVALDARAARSVSAILEQAARIKEIIHAFLSLARGGSPSLERIEPRELADAAVELVLHRFEQVGVSVVTTACERLPLVACDRRLLEQALVNLLLNACDACSRGGHVLLDVVRAPEGEVAFVVIDDGAGISEEASARATEPFFTTKPEGAGTGLGLAIAHEIVQHHRGTLRVIPRHDARGSEARITLPPAGATGRETESPLASRSA